MGEWFDYEDKEAPYEKILPVTAVLWPYVYSLWFGPQRWEFFISFCLYRDVWFDFIQTIKEFFLSCIPKPSFIHSYSLYLRYNKARRIFFTQFVPSGVASDVHMSVYQCHALDRCKNLRGGTKVSFFAKYNKIELNCDKRLAKNKLIYLEDLVIFFNKVIAQAVEDLYCKIYCKIVMANAYLL